MTLLKKSLLLSAAATVATLVSARPASADTILASYSFSNITGNSIADANTAGQYTVDVVDIGVAGQVAFVFHNAGPLASSITDIYFDDGALLSLATVSAATVFVDFSQFASPPNLPGGNAVDFNVTAGFSADSNNPTQPMGVNPGESVTITFTLENGLNAADVLTALALGLANPGEDVEGGLRIGIHVQGFAGGGSESFVNNNTVPDGGTTMALLGMAMTGLGLVARRRKK